MRVSPAAGAFRHFISLQRDDGVNEFNEPTKAWAEVDRVWASIEPASASSARGAHETLAAGALTPTDYYLITLYPYPGVAPGWRAVDTDTGDIYALDAVRRSNDRSKVTFVSRLGASDG